MKFFNAVVALVATMATGSDAAKPTNAHQWKRELSNRMKNGQFDKKTLLRNAKPHNDAAKKRALNNNDDGWQVTASHNLQFISCFSYTTSYEELFEGDGNNANGALVNMFSQGQVLALQSYAIFRLCYGSCDADSNQNLEYVVDLNTYVQSLVNYLPDKMEEYCNACKENTDSCTAMLYGQYGQYGNQQQNQAYTYNGGRKLADIHNFETRVLNEGQVVKQLDCELCGQYNCLDNDDNNNGDEYGFEAASEWLNDIAECKDLETNYNPSGGYYGGGNQQGGDENKLYAGFLCNGDGSGVEIGLFANEDCSLYLTNEPFSKYMTYYDTNYADMTKELVEFTFSNAVFSCKDEEVVYTTQNLNGYNGNYYNGGYNWDQDERVAEWCSGLFENEYPATDMATCGQGYGNQYNANYYTNQYYNNNDDQASYRAQQYNWYQYDISEDNAVDMGAVCSLAKKSEGELHTFYNTSNGNMYSYTNADSASDNISDFLNGTGSKLSFISHKFWSYTKKSMSGFAKFTIVACTGLLVGAGVALFHRYKTSAEDDKNVGLIDPTVAQTGEVA